MAQNDTIKTQSIDVCRLMKETIWSILCVCIIFKAKCDCTWPERMVLKLFDRHQLNIIFKHKRRKYLKKNYQLKKETATTIRLVYWWLCRWLKADEWWWLKTNRNAIWLKNTLPGRIENCYPHTHSLTHTYLYDDTLVYYIATGILFVFWLI